MSDANQEDTNGAQTDSSNERTTSEPPPSPPHTAKSESPLPTSMAAAAVMTVQETETTATTTSNSIAFDSDMAPPAASTTSDESFSTPPKPGYAADSSNNSSNRLPEEAPAPEVIAASKPLPPSPNTPSASRIQAKANTLSPREQEAADQTMMEGMSAMFNNRFSAAKSIFEARANEDPLYSLGMGAMAFIKAIISSTSFDANQAIAELSETYEFANAQVEAAQAKKPLKDTVSQIFTNLLGTNTTGLPTNTRPLSQNELKEQSGFMANGALRAHVIKAECGLLMSLVYLSEETVLGYLKMGLNLRRAYSSYSLVWQEYKRMGQDFHKHMDANTIAAVQFGIGSVHLVLSSLPPKILKVISAFGWHADRNLGFALLKLCLESKTIRSPLASMMLLTYYVVLTSHAPLILNSELMQPAVDCLMDAQKTYPNSAFFLYFAGRVSRLSRSISLSTQSFQYARQVSQGDWAEAPMATLTGYDTAFNHTMLLNWTAAAEQLAQLESSHSRQSFVKFFYGACMEMAGDRSAAVLAFAEAAHLARIKKKNATQLDQFVSERVSFYENSGYQDLDLSLPVLEILLLWNSLACMSHEMLAECTDKVDEVLARIFERERQEHHIRTLEIAPNVDPPDYYCERATLLLIKVSILNAMGRSHEAIVHLNWILDNRSRIVGAKWIVPFTYWEAGVASWCMDDRIRALDLWQQALGISGYVLEYQLAIRLNLAIIHANDLGVAAPTESPKNEKRNSIGQNGHRWSFPGSSQSSSESPR